MSCDHELANEWARGSGKNASSITSEVIRDCMLSFFAAVCCLPLRWLVTLTSRVDDFGKSLMVVEGPHILHTATRLLSSLFF